MMIQDPSPTIELEETFAFRGSAAKQNVHLIWV